MHCFSIHPLLEQISAMKQFLGVKWFLRILSGRTPFDLTKTIIVQDISHKRLDLAQQRKRIWALNKKDVLNRYNKNNGGIIRHKF